MVSDATEQGVKLLWRSLNPCSNGIWSLTYLAALSVALHSSLNPCSNGIWSLTRLEKATRKAMCSS